MKVLLALLLSLPAQAAVIGTVAGNGGRIDLHDDPGACVAGARRAEFVPEQGSMVPGCWKPSEAAPAVVVVFFDCDIATVPLQAIRPVKAL